MDWVLQAARPDSFLAADFAMSALRCSEAGGRNISREEFASWLEDENFVHVLDEAGSWRPRITGTNFGCRRHWYTVACRRALMRLAGLVSLMCWTPMEVES